ncbi:MAG: hypothetical protein N3G19_00725 [Candidatus Pacearchaeota archaeon]|nr:hypothetical protein [Candidatus Pacearchaeota archaeon]
MKLQILALLVIALIALLPLTSAAIQQDNKILPIAGNKTMTKEQLREKFLGEENFRAQLRNRIQNCIGNESEECEGIRIQARETVRGVIGKVCQNTNEVMERVRTRIQNNPKLTDEEKKNLIQVINEQETKFQGLCKEINEASQERLREIAREMKRVMKETKIKFGITKELVHMKRVGLVLEKAEHLETKLQDFVEKWNVTDCDIENLTEQFNIKVAEARASYDESQELWQQFKESVKNREPDTELLREAQNKLKEAQFELKEAHKILKQIITELRECKESNKVEE